MKDTNWMIEGLFAHRGLHNDNFPENTLGAFKHAVDKNYDIECDIQLTTDNQIVVFHDDNMKRLCGIDKRVQDCSYEELKQLKVLNSEEGIPLLSDLFEILPKETKLLIEFKPSRRHTEVVTLFLDYMSSVENTYAIHSFDPRILIDFKNLAPQVIRGFITEKFKYKEHGLIGKVCGHLLILKSMKPDFINYGIKDLPYKKLDRLRTKGMIIFSYTAKTQKDLDFVRDRYDNAVFEGFEAK